MDDNKGINMMLVNNPKADAVFEVLKDKMKLKQSTMKEVFIKNHQKPTKDKRQRTAFFNELDQKTD